ncbi:MAG: hypothetical protein NUV31_07410 [Dehalococcoidales bacterium]|jgi:hypothetical protein|nr:hypothetical protein [Dehalococcoidales bacterium]
MAEAKEAEVKQEEVKQASSSETKAVRKKASSTTRKRMSKGDVYECEVCGLSVVIDEVCGCAEVCDIICCSKPMKEKKIKVKAAK